MLFQRVLLVTHVCDVYRVPRDSHKALLSVSMAADIYGIRYQCSYQVPRDGDSLLSQAANKNTWTALKAWARGREA